MLWKMFDVLVDYIDMLFKMIVGIEIEIMCIEGKFKLSQNKEIWDIVGVGEVFKVNGECVISDVMFVCVVVKME